MQKEPEVLVVVVCAYLCVETGGGYDRVSSPGSRADAAAPVGLLADPGDGRRK